MTLLELHPDELLARDASGTLTPSEWADLSAHLERCPACALERNARREAARFRTPSDLDHAIAARVVGRLLAGQDRGLAFAKSGTGGGRTTRRKLVYAALVLVLVSGTTTAGAALVVQIRQRAAARVEPVARPEAARPAPRRYRSARVSAPRGDEKQVEPSVMPPEPAPAAIEPSPPVGPVGPDVVARPETGAGRPKTGARPRSFSARVLPQRPPADAATLLNQAEAAASAGRIGDASGLYGELRRWFPGTREEIVARALHGQLLLDGLGNPARGLALFEGYLSAEPTGTLAEEARLGRARALERLGRASAERSAWLELLRAHPRSVHAAAARARLAILDGQ